jgi:hypothetical protein
MNVDRNKCFYEKIGCQVFPEESRKYLLAWGIFHSRTVDDLGGDSESLRFGPTLTMLEWHGTGQHGGSEPIEGV